MSRNGSRRGRRMSRGRTRIGALAILLASAVAGTLVIQIGMASAASRGFFIYNHSKHALRLERVQSLLFYRAKYGCDNDICRRGGHLGFEGHPHPGAVLEPDAAPHDFELKYHVDTTLQGKCWYAAFLEYKIQGTDSTFDVLIETCTFSNNSFCKVTPERNPAIWHCPAEPFAGGRKITFGGH
jgi:hypothetical protein